MEAIFLVCGAGEPQLKRNPLGAIPVTPTRHAAPVSLFGRLAGLLLIAAGGLAGLILYSELKLWSDSVYVRLAMLIPTGGAVAFALLQGGHMFLARTPRDLGIPGGLRALAFGTIVSGFLFSLLRRLPTTLKADPEAAVVLVLQTVIIVVGLLPLLRGSDRRRKDGA